MNSDKVTDPNVIQSGTVLKVERASTPVNISRNGDRYLIKQGDTLGTISQDVYGSNRKWKRIWENNPELIKDPNKIFAGFYVYYTFTPDDQQEKDSGGSPRMPASNTSSSNVQNNAVSAAEGMSNVNPAGGAPSGFGDQVDLAQ